MRIPPLLIQCALVGAVALTTAVAWLRLTGSRALSPAAVIVCTVIAVVVSLAVEHLVRLVRRGRPRRAHARPHPKTRKEAA
ncbi:hypothetical protein [Streptomyces griseosporeus]|uniref:hypothetical protein n=1 Tax=Streptomyces griseosporeus TaxID=1910 RepID=UPI0036F507B3